MRITLKKILKSVTPYGFIVANRKLRAHMDRVKVERSIQITRDKELTEALIGVKSIKPKDNPTIVVSMTSYGHRINKTAPLALASLFRQSVLPDKLVLWLARGEKQPPSLKKMTALGLEIKYYDDIGSYKKLIPSLEEYPDSTIITVDDDINYPKDWLKKTLESHKKYPKAIIFHRARQIIINDNTLSTYLDWPILDKNIKNNHLVVPTGVGGVLYPPHSLSDKVLDRDEFMRVAPYADDLWFWAMAGLKGTKKKIVENGYNNITDFEMDWENGIGVRVNNTDATNGNDAQFMRIIDLFPSLRDKIGLSVTREDFPGSQAYWERRYASGGNSGVGSYDNLAKFKTEILNKFVTKNKINTVIEFGCGDGNQLLEANYPNYIGFDVSETIIKSCKSMFQGDKTKKFYTLDKFNKHKSDLAMSLDVLYHLVEEDVFEEHLRSLFKASKKYVIIYAFDGEGIETGPHVRSRKFTSYVAKNMPEWKLIEHIPNKYPYDEANPIHTSWADFYIYEK